MPRPPLVIGTWGKINRTQRSKTVWVAYARYRDYDGHTRQLERTGTTAQKAEDALKAALRDRLGSAEDEITADSKIERVARTWIDDEIAGRRAENTERLYRRTVENVIIPGLGGVRVREVTVAGLDRFLRAVTVNRGPGTARTTKIVLSGILASAARTGALDHNPLRDVATIRQAPAKPVEVLDLNQLWDLRRRMYADDLAVLRDLPEPIDFMLATGVRIGEMLAVRWFDLDLDAEKPTVLIRATVVGSRIQERPKTSSSRRRLTLPAWSVTMLRTRHTAAPPNDLQLVFPSTRGTVRDSSNLRRHWRELRASIGYEWVKPHTFRKSIATLADDPELAAQQLGHADSSMTKQHYIPKVHDGPDLRSVLDPIAAPAFTQRKQRRKTTPNDSQRRATGA